MDTERIDSTKAAIAKRLAAKPVEKDEIFTKLSYLVLDYYTYEDFSNGDAREAHSELEQYVLKEVAPKAGLDDGEQRFLKDYMDSYHLLSEVQTGMIGNLDGTAHVNACFEAIERAGTRAAEEYNPEFKDHAKSIPIDISGKINALVAYVEQNSPGVWKKERQVYQKMQEAATRAAAFLEKL